MSKKPKVLLSLSRLLLPAVLSLALFLRLFRIHDLLGFWYDQGRDALVIWDFIHKGKLFLIGPMMADTGIFRGPWYYWLITPFYWLSNGDPLWVSVFLILTTVVAIFVIYRLGGLKPAFIAAISMYIVGASRWLADPTPTLLVSALLVWAAFNFLKKKVWALPLIGFLIGLALNFSAAAEVFYIPAVLLIVYLKRKDLPSFKILLLSVSLFLLTFLPQVIFEIRHPGVQTGAFYQFVFKDNSFTFSFWEILKERLPFYYNLFASKFWPNGGFIFAPFFVVFVFSLVANWKKFWKDDKFKILFILSLVPIIGTLFFTGSKGNIYEYYFTGYYLIWILLFSKVVTNKVIFAVFVLVSIFMNYLSFKSEYLKSSGGANVIAFSNQKKAIDWIYKDSNGKDFNVDVYVPPVIPYAYNYLFQWLGTARYNRLPVENNISLLYTLAEADPDHPDRINAWTERQKGIGKIEKSATFGGITVERRTILK
jgi:hypothetical protein